MTKLLRAATRSAQRGFTLIELMVVLVIIGVLAALIVPNVIERADDARVTAAKTDINNLMQALKLYRLDNQRYPTGEQGLQALLARPPARPRPTGSLILPLIYGHLSKRLILPLIYGHLSKRHCPARTALG
ncbi:type II secretion system major pseudopilin GspG [Variovorax sp.]|uniref:type II secretion system major pseudopilin GspG n=1 Tax=Variovorax sp. TaxID=1871043 RepID=UPI00137C4A12|nr:type II secretion system major pseudopilin GspG [Variovorax sp.]KAF1057068.1 MAG: Type II secretion system protein G [Variovorax sp.]